MASPVKVLHAPHTGITVRSLERSTHLFHNILNLPVQRTARLSPPISTITGHSQVEIDIAIIELPGGHCVELLEYSLPVEEKQVEMKPMSWEVGSWHLCLTVQSLDDTVKALTEYDSSWTTMAAPQLLEKGPNAGRRLVYLRNKEDGLILELFE